MKGRCEGATLGHRRGLSSEHSRRHAASCRAVGRPSSSRRSPPRPPPHPTAPSARCRKGDGSNRVGRGDRDMPPVLQLPSPRRRRLQHDRGAAARLRRRREVRSEADRLQPQDLPQPLADRQGPGRRRRQHRRRLHPATPSPRSITRTTRRPPRWSSTCSSSSARTAPGRSRRSATARRRWAASSPTPASAMSALKRTARRRTSRRAELQKRIDAAFAKGRDWLLANKPDSTEDTRLPPAGAGGRRRWKRRTIEAARTRSTEGAASDGSWAQLRAWPATPTRPPPRWWRCARAGLDATSGLPQGVKYLLARSGRRRLARPDASQAAAGVLRQRRPGRQVAVHLVRGDQLGGAGTAGDVAHRSS